MNKDALNQLSSSVINGAICVHRELGPGLLESVYQSCLAYELKERGMEVVTEVALPIFYRGNRIESGLRLDMIIENRLVIELKSVEKVLPVHVKQLLTYLRLADMPLGLLINFNESLLKDGITRLANNPYL
ncbi:GxxExxY protein [Desulfuromonas sp. KJ2020]|nr:GxxExxY protein [Desulfuromonas sp. KJ2020]MCP3177048.1 GxxExxY protein [Desulfuromonas sp. KJ2020]